jgi:hypothetical protein
VVAVDALDSPQSLLKGRSVGNNPAIVVVEIEFVIIPD